MTTATIGGLGVKASRSTVKVVTVPVASAMGTSLIRSTAPHFTQTRTGGRWIAPQFSQRLPTKAYL